MKIAVINFSGNVGKTTVARHLLVPRIAGAELIAVESINADDGQNQAVRGSQFGELQEYLQTVENVVVDIGASNAEDLLALMRKYLPEEIGVAAAGGIRTLDQVLEVYQAGCTRIGTTSTAAILNEWQARLTPPPHP